MAEVDKITIEPEYHESFLNQVNTLCGYCVGCGKIDFADNLIQIGVNEYGVMESVCDDCAGY